MKNLKLLSIFFIAASLFSCKSRMTDIKAMADQFADMECRAITLREQRFNLANDIRFTQDTLMHTKNTSDTMRLHLKLEAFDKQKEVTLKQSLSLADSIHTQLNQMKEKLTDKNDRAKFEEMLNSNLQQRGCVKG